MNRLTSLVAASAIGFGILFLSGFAERAAAGDAATESKRSYSYVERFNGFRGTITATASANAPISCNFRMTWSMESQDIAVIANCRLAPDSRNGQRAVISGEIVERYPGEPDDVIGRCRDVQPSDPGSGKVKLRCDFGLVFE